MKISKKFKVVRHMQQVARRRIRETNGRGKRFYDRNLSTANLNTRWLSTQDGKTQKQDGIQNNNSTEANLKHSLDHKK